MSEKFTREKAICAFFRASDIALEQSSVIFSNVNSTKPVWWFDIPLIKVTSTKFSELNLLALSNDGQRLYHLKVPTSFLRDNLNLLYIRAVKESISLELSTLGSNLFKDVRPTSGQLDFKQFLNSTVPIDELLGIECQQSNFLGNSFEGGIRIAELKNCTNVLPDKMGVYLIVRKNLEQPVHILKEGTGGWHKGKDPNVDSMERVSEKWIPSSNILYIGKAGGSGMKATLRTRLNSYIRFGSGKKAPHAGGRYIWRIEDSDNLLVYWQSTTSIEPSALEAILLHEFEAKYGQLPFANLKH